MKKFFKKVVNKVKEVIHMAVNKVYEAEIVKAEAIIHAEDLVAEGVKGAINIGKDVVRSGKDVVNTFGASLFEYLENKDNIKAAEKEKVVDVVGDILSGTKRNSKYVGIISISVALGVSLCVGCVGTGLILADKFA